MRLPLSKRLLKGSVRRDERLAALKQLRAEKAAQQSPSSRVLTPGHYDVLAEISGMLNVPASEFIITVLAPGSQIFEVIAAPTKQ